MLNTYIKGHLELRRIHYDLTLTYQIVFGLSVLKYHGFFQLSGRSTTSSKEMSAITTTLLLHELKPMTACSYYTRSSV